MQTHIQLTQDDIYNLCKLKFLLKPKKLYANKVAGQEDYIVYEGQPIYRADNLHATFKWIPAHLMPIRFVRIWLKPKDVQDKFLMYFERINTCE